MGDTKKLDVFFIFFLVIFSLLFFSAKFALTGVFKNISYAYMMAAICISLPYFFRKSYGFIFPIQMISISIVISIVTSYISWGQGLTYSVSTVPCLICLVFFYLLRKNFPLIKIETIVLFYGSLYIILYLFQFLHSNVVYFGFTEEFKEDRGVTRILFPGAGIFFLAFFISLNKVSEKSRYRGFFVLFLILGMAVTVLQVTRQSIALLLIITFFHFVKKVSFVKKAIITIFFSFLVIFLLNSDNPISRGMLETQKETVSDGDKYIRVLSGSYFLNDFSPNLLSRIFGNGLPNNTSKYGKFTKSLEENYGYYMADVGLIGLYAMFGIFAVLGYIIIFAKSLFMKVPENYSYLKYYMWMLLATCLTSNAVYSIHFMIANVFVFYGYQYLYEQEKLTELSNLIADQLDAVSTTNIDDNNK